MLTIKTKIVLAYTAVFGIMLGSFAFFIYKNYREAELAKIDARLESWAARISNDLEEGADDPTHPEPKMILMNAAKNIPGARMQIIGRSGELIVADSVLSQSLSSTWERSFIDGRRFDFLPADKKKYRSIWVPVDINDQVVTVLQLALPLHEYHESLEQMRVLFLTIIPLGLLIMGIAAYFITRFAFSPMSRMVETAKTITAQNLHERLQIPRAHDEVQQLGNTLNEMIGRIQAGFDSQKQFIADASHEIRTPLTVICSELEYVQQQTTDPEVKESMQTSLSEIDRLVKLADGLLLLAKLDASQLTLNIEQVRVDEVILECVQLNSTIAVKKKIRIRVNIDEVVEISCDREKLKSILLNLLDNAIKYTHSDSIVTVALSPAGPKKKTVTITVTDEGPGIPQSALHNIFNRFYRVDASRTENPGTGLGLAIVDRLVKLHGGNISVNSENGKGTTFIVELPLIVNNVSS